jgi:hypothetical protein
MDRPPRSDHVTDLEVGYDRFVAQAIAAECDANGLAVQLLTMDNAGQSPGILALQPHRVLSRVDDAEAVQQIIRGWIPDDVDQSAPPRQRRHPLVWIAAAMLLAIVAFALLGGLLASF